MPQTLQSVVVPPISPPLCPCERERRFRSTLRLFLPPTTYRTYIPIPSRLQYTTPSPPALSSSQSSYRQAQYCLLLQIRLRLLHTAGKVHSKLSVNHNSSKARHTATPAIPDGHEAANTAVRVFITPASFLACALACFERLCGGFPHYLLYNSSQLLTACSWIRIPRARNRQVVRPLHSSSHSLSLPRSRRSPRRGHRTLGSKGRRASSCRRL